MSLDVLYRPFEAIDAWLTALFSGAPLGVALLIAFLLGLRHASDPDHLVAVTSLVAARDGDVRSGVRLGAWWGVGHAATLVVLGVPLVALKSRMPGWIEAGAERAVGVVIVLLAARVLWKWLRGGYRAGRHAHAAAARGGDVRDTAHRHVHEHHGHGHRGRTGWQSLAIGVMHGLGGTGSVVVLLIAALPDRLEAIAALAVFAPMSVVSMALCTGVYSWALTRPLLAPVYRTVLIPAMATFGVVFGAWYAGLG